MKKICVSLLVSLSPFLAQVPTTAITGEIVNGPGWDASWLTVRLIAPGGRALFVTAHIDPGGSFTLSGVEPGSYILQVLDVGSNEIASQPVTVFNTGNAPLSIRLPERRVDRPTGQTVSAERLLHPPAKRALRAARKAQKLSQSGNHARAAAELEGAVRDDPYFSDAYNNLGVQYMRLGRSADAVAAFRRAIALDPGGPLQRANLAVTLACSGRLEEAETWASSSVRLDPANPESRRILEGIRSALRPARDPGHRTAAPEGRKVEE